MPQVRTSTCGDDPLGYACFHPAIGERFGGRQGRFGRVRPQRRRPCLAVLKLWSSDVAELKGWSHSFLPLQTDLGVMSIFEVRQQGLGQVVLTTQYLLQKRSRCPVRRITSSTDSSDHLGPLLIGLLSQLGACVVESVSVVAGEAVTTDWCREVLGVRAPLAKRVFDVKGVREGRST